MVQLVQINIAIFPFVVALLSQEQQVRYTALISWPIVLGATPKAWNLESNDIINKTLRIFLHRWWKGLRASPIPVCLQYNTNLCLPFINMLFLHISCHPKVCHFTSFIYSNQNISSGKVSMNNLQCEISFHKSLKPCKSHGPVKALGSFCLTLMLLHFIKFWSYFLRFDTKWIGYICPNKSSVSFTSLHFNPHRSVQPEINFMKSPLSRGFIKTQKQNVDESEGTWVFFTVSMYNCKMETV